jgi:succinate dehydrogenase / fumarate reductase cytochrome b subunit
MYRLLDQQAHLAQGNANERLESIKSTTMAKRDRPLVRPLSPFMHYRKGYTMVLSILHRITGVAMTVGTLLFVYWLVAAASGLHSYEAAQSVFSCVWVQLAIVGWVFSFCYHFLNGLRHLVWDAGHGFDLTVSRNSGYAVFGGAILLTILVCVVFMARTGGAV